MQKPQSPIRSFLFPKPFLVLVPTEIKNTMKKKEASRKLESRQGVVNWNWSLYIYERDRQKLLLRQQSSHACGAHLCLGVRSELLGRRCISKGYSSSSSRKPPQATAAHRHACLLLPSPWTRQDSSGMYAVCIS